VTSSLIPERQAKPNAYSLMQVYIFFTTRSMLENCIEQDRQSCDKCPDWCPMSLNVDAHDLLDDIRPWSTWTKLEETKF
jgi:hypothetical protein